MRKRIVGRSDRKISGDGGEQLWLDLERLAVAEISSEDPGHPFESALVPGMASGWRAAEAGAQTIRLLFDRPLRLTRLRLVFREEQQARTQEFVLRWSTDGGRSYRDIVRQQYTFSPPATTSEAEDYRVDLDGVTALELRIVPDISGSDVRASLAGLQLA